MSESRSSSPPDLPALSARAVDSWSSIPDEQRLRAMLDATCDIVWETPQDGQLHGSQPGWSAFTGQPADAYLGKGWLNAVHPDDRAIVAGPWSAALAGRPFFEAQYRLRHADGGYRHMTLRAMPLAASDGSGGSGGWVGAHTDISERKRAEERLRLAMKGGMGTWDLDLGSGLMSCSDACKANFGRAPGERLDYDDMLASIAEPDLVRWRDTLHRAIALGRDFDIECRLRWPDQSLHWTQLRGSCTFDAAGGVIGMSGISLDLTASKRSEQVLQDTLARHDATMAAGEVATWTWDIVADTVIADRNMNRLFLGRDGETGSAPLQLFLDAIHPGDIERVQHEIEQAIGQGTAYETSYRVRSPAADEKGDAAYRSVIARGRAEYSFDGAPLRLPGVILDVTRQRQVEERLHSSEERYRHLVELMDQAFCEIEVLFDADGNACDYRYLEVNSSFIEQSGLPDAVGKTILEMVPGHEIYWARLYGQVAASGVAVRVESEARAMNRWFDIYAARVGGPGSCRVAILFTDITERKRSEQQLRLLADDLSEMDRRKTEFLATLAHELRNPLAPIRNGLQIMRMAADNPATVARVRDVMERQVNQMVHLVNDLLDVARITRGQIELKTELVDLKTIVAGAVETSFPLIDTNRHALAIDIGEAALPLEADPTRLAQVLANLLNNAAKYTPPGGRIGITARRSDDGDGEGDVVVTVSDSGVGIPQECLDSVFDMFTQVGENMHRAQGGLGIGLSLVRRLVELHGGSVSASSAGAGLGSTFSVRLPLALDAVASAAVAAVAGPPAAPQAHPGRKLRVLVVDDNLDAADTLADLLGMLGHATQIAHDGPQALLAAGEFLPELVFLDIGLPGISGYDVARALRQDQRFSATVLAALTGWGAADDRSQSSAAGFDHHLTKPANLDTIKQLLASLGASAAG